MLINWEPFAREVCLTALINEGVPKDEAAMRVAARWEEISTQLLDLHGWMGQRTSEKAADVPGLDDEDCRIIQARSNPRAHLARQLKAWAVATLTSVDPVPVALPAERRAAAGIVQPSRRRPGGKLGLGAGTPGRSLPK